MLTGQRRPLSTTGLGSNAKLGGDTHTHACMHACVETHTHSNIKEYYSAI